MDILFLKFHDLCKKSKREDIFLLVREYMQSMKFQASLKYFYLQQGNRHDYSNLISPLKIPLGLHLVLLKLLSKLTYEDFHTELSKVGNKTEDIKSTNTFRVSKNKNNDIYRSSYNQSTNIKTTVCGYARNTPSRSRSTITGIMKRICDTTSPRQKDIHEKCNIQDITSDNEVISQDTLLSIWSNWKTGTFIEYFSFSKTYD